MVTTAKGIWISRKGHGVHFKVRRITAKGTSWITFEHLLRFYVQKGLKRSGVSLSLLQGPGSFRRRRIDSFFKIARGGVRGVVYLKNSGTWRRQERGRR